MANDVALVLGGSGATGNAWEIGVIAGGGAAAGHGRRPAAAPALAGPAHDRGRH
ncbi:MAG TPA: hypothetical protein VH478_22685 [Trebonia sp.]|nr:hypothetical protein [Trebonia sp.]